MNKAEFVEFLNEMTTVNLNYWRKISTDSDDHWQLYKPFVDWFEDDMDLSVEGIVRITYNKSLYENESAKIFETTYDDFAKNYGDTI
jgi:hypothetical protein